MDHQILPYYERTTMPVDLTKPVSLRKRNPENQRRERPRVDLNVWGFPGDGPLVVRWVPLHYTPDPALTAMLRFTLA